MNSILLKNALICEKTKDIKTDIFINNGVISEISDNCTIFDDTKIIDVQGKYVLPGLIDLNCEVCEPGLDYMEDITSVSKSAVKSGFTSVTANPNTDPIIDNKIIVKHLKMLAKEKALINIFPYGHMTKDGKGEELSGMGEMYKEGIVGVSDGNDSVQDSFVMKNVFNYAKMFDIPIITYCENKLLKNNGLINLGYASVLTGLKGIPASAEKMYVARNIILAEEEDCKVHITKVSTSSSVNLIRFAKKQGIKVTCDTCPQYIMLNEESVLDYDTRFKINPPLRTKSDNEAIIEALKDGTIDSISTGHHPKEVSSKLREFESASFGFAGLEPAFLVCYNNLVLNNHLSLFELIEKLSNNGYDILKIKNKGKIAIGYDADLFIFNAESETTIDESKIESKAKYSVYNGVTFKGAVDLTIVAGNIVYNIDENTFNL